MPDALKVTVNDDVAKPGTTLPDATSRPIITANGPAVADPMVNEEKPAAKEVPDAVAAGGGSMTPRVTPASSTDEVTKDATDADDKKLAEQTIEKKEEPLDKQAKLGEIIESGEYNVNIKQSKSGSAGTFFMTIVLVLLIGLIVVYVLADLEIVDLGIKLPFELFK